MTSDRTFQPQLLFVTCLAALAQPHLPVLDWTVVRVWLMTVLPPFLQLLLVTWLAALSQLQLPVLGLGCRPARSFRPFWIRLPFSPGKIKSSSLIFSTRFRRQLFWALLVSGGKERTSEEGVQWTAVAAAAAASSSTHTHGIRHLHSLKIKTSSMIPKTRQHDS
jgi:hypothetical protein